MPKKLVMLFYRLKDNKKIYGLEDLVQDLVFNGVSLEEYQRQVIEKCGHELNDIFSKDETSKEESHYFIFDEDLFFTKEFIKIVVKISSNAKESFQCALAENQFNERFVLPQREDGKSVFNFFYIYNNESAENIKIVHQVTYENIIEIPSQIVKGGILHYDLCDTFISRMASPFHYLQTSLALHFMKGVRSRKILPKWFFDKFVTGNSKPFYFFLKRMNKIGKNCKIHPTAILEGATLGDNVTIGAYSVIRMSTIASGTKIEDHVIVKYSVIGKSNYISHANQIIFCQTLEEVFLIHGPYQFSFFGRKSAAMAVINCDVRLDQKTISIPTDIGVIDSKQPLLGICYGHESIVGGGNIIAAGRFVPNYLKKTPPGIVLHFKDSKNDK